MFKHTHGSKFRYMIDQQLCQNDSIHPQAEIQSGEACVPTKEDMFPIFSNFAIMVLDVNFTNHYKTADFLFFDDKEDANLFCRNPADSNSHPGSRINGTRYRTDEPDTSNVAHPKVVFAIQNSVPWYCFGQSPDFSIPYRSACLLHFTGGVDGWMDGWMDGCALRSLGLTPL